MPAARLTPDDNEARSDWWISSKAYFDGFIGQVERVPFDLSRQNMYEIPSDIYREFDEQKREIERNKKEVDNIKEEMRKFRQEMNVQPVRQENKEPIIVEQHYGLSDFSQFQSMQGGPSSFQGHMSAQSATQYWQPGTSSQHGSYYSFGRVPSHMGRQNLQTTIETHDDVDGIFDQNVDPTKVRRGNYVNLPAFLNDPHQIYLDCYMKGYIVPVSFWQQLVPHFCMPDMHRLPYGTPIGWLSGEHMNSWMELLIRRRNAKANWTVAYTGTISVHPENNQFIIPTDQHVIGTLDGTTRPYPAWNDVDWVFMPIHVAGNHWATEIKPVVRGQNDFHINDSLQLQNEPHFSNPESSFAFRSNEYNTDDVVNENPQKKFHKWQKFMSFEPDIPETPVYNAKPNISKQYTQQSEVEKGNIFDNKEALILAVRLKALNEGFQFLTDRSAPERCHLKCYHFTQCDWKLRARLWDNTEQYYITHLNDVHTCPKTQTYPNHRNANKKVIGHLLTPKLQDRSRVLRGKDIQQDILSEYKIHISYQQAMKGKHYGIQQSINACSEIHRKELVLKLAETYRAMVQEWYYQRQQLAANIRYEITDWRSTKQTKWLKKG
ncbi:transposase, MuDR, MULE transposase domain protein [Tanacetum coccineum]